MIVVSDTSPLNYLVLVGAIDVLPQLFLEVFTPPEVIGELLHAKTPAPAREWAQAPPPWLKIVAPRDSIHAVTDLGPGELNAIALALELRADRVLTDDRDARAFAAARGLRPYGTLSVLEDAAGSRLLDLPDAIARLRQTSFRISQSLVDAAMKRDRMRKLSEHGQGGLSD